MKIIPSSMEFKGYEIVKATYTTNDVQTPPETEFKLQPTFSRKIVKSSDEEYQLFLGVTIGECENDSEIELPFTLEVIVKGTFVPKGFDDAEKAMKVNAVAIMFPYLRSTLAVFTTLMNINPVNLPTINLVAMFEENKKNADEKEE